MPKDKEKPLLSADAAQDLPKITDAQEFPIGKTVCERVTVFADRAEVTRTQAVKLKRGEQQVKFTDISLSVDPESVRVGGGGQAIILEVTTEVVKVVEAPVVVSPEQHQELESNRERSKLLRQELARIAKERAFLVGAQRQQSVVVEGVPRVSVADAAAVARFCQQEDERLEARKCDIDVELDTLRDQISALEVLLAKQSKEVKIGERRVVTVLLAADVDNESEVSLMYIISGASWRAAYDLRVTSTDLNFALSYFGTVINNTGEDWNDTSMSLSTATPEISGNLPQLLTMHVYLTNKAQEARQREALGGLSPSSSTPSSSALGGGSSAGGSGGGPPVANLCSEVDSSGTTHSFIIPRNTTTPSDNKPHKFAITQVSMAAKFNWHCVPKENENVFLRAVCTNTSAFPLLAGPLAVYLDNNFCASSMMNETYPNRELEVFLGVDSSITVKFMTIQNDGKEKDSGLMNKKSHRKFKYELHISSRKKVPAHLDVFVPIPKPAHEDIKITMISPSQESLTKQKEKDDKKKAAASGASSTTLSPPSARGTSSAASVASEDDGRLAPGEEKIVMDEITNNINYKMCLAPNADADAVKIYKIEYSVQYPKEKRVAYNYVR